MRFVKVRYDGYNGQFNVTERQFGAEPDDEPMYLIDDFIQRAIQCNRAAVWRGTGRRTNVSYRRFYEAGFPFDCRP